MKAWQHLKTINHHKMLVMKGCFRVGLYKQGLLHDLSKYSPTEFLVGCKYFQGNKSPNSMERLEKGIPRPGCTIREGTSTIWNIGWTMAWGKIMKESRA